MSSYKRKWEETDDSDEEPAYGKQILPVANLPEDFNEEPMDGMQYLFMVRRDARHLPSTVRVPNPYEQPETTIIRTEIEDSVASASQLPSEEWRKCYEKRFRNFRKNFAQPTTRIGPTVPPQHTLIPDKKERDMWWAFLSGEPESEWTSSKKGQKGRKQSAGIDALSEEHSAVQNSWNDEGEDDEELMTYSADSLPCAMDTPLPLEYLEALNQPSTSTSAAPSRPPQEETPVPREPTTQFLKLINERAALHLLMYFTYWINRHLSSLDSGTYLPTETHARWIFSLLSRIDDFISPDDINLLRNLARACIGLLKQIKKQETLIDPSMMSESSCWIIIATVAEVWKQKDLWMDADNTLRMYKA